MVYKIELDAVGRNSEGRVARVWVTKNGSINRINLAGKRCGRINDVIHFTTEWFKDMFKFENPLFVCYACYAFVMDRIASNGYKVNV